MNRHLIHLYPVAMLGFVLLSAPAGAQSTPAPLTSEPAIGEDYRIEVAAGVWATVPSTVQYSDTENGLTGTNIDFKQQLGLSNQRFPEFHLVVRATAKHKFRAELIPLNYQQTTTLTTNLNYGGQPFLAGQAVSSTLQWNAWRGVYEYDVITGARGYVGGIVGLNDVVVNGTLANGSQSVTSNVQIPMPGLGVIVRYYPWARLSITGESMGFDLPGRSTHTHGHAIDVDASATANISKHVGIEGGYRAFDVSYTFGTAVNSGTFMIRGPYIGGIVRY